MRSNCDSEQVPDAGVPEWSGTFWNDGEFGYLSVAWGDDEYHRPPGCWRLCDSYATKEAEVFVYRKVSCWLPEQLMVLAAVALPWVTCLGIGVTAAAGVNMGPGVPFS